MVVHIIDKQYHGSFPNITSAKHVCKQCCDTMNVQVVENEVKTPQDELGCTVDGRDVGIVHEMAKLRQPCDVHMTAVFPEDRELALSFRPLRR